MSTCYKLILISFCTILTFNCNAQAGFISDNVYTYIHKGPSAKFKILGSINAGDSVEILERSDNGDYTKIVDTKGREGWVMSKFTSLTPSIKKRYTDLQNSLEEKVASNNNLIAQRNSHSDEINKLKDSHISQIEQLNNSIAQLKIDLSKANNENLIIQTQLKGEDEDIKIKWLTNGGVLVLISLFIGFIMRSLISKKKNKNSW